MDTIRPQPSHTKPHRPTSSDTDRLTIVGDKNASSVKSAAEFWERLGL